MNQKDKELLLQYLCMALPYEVKVVYSDFIMEVRGIDSVSHTADIIEYGKHRFSAVPIKEIKPYLRPMSSMTAEEKSYYEDRWFEGYHAKHGDDMVSEPEIPSYIDWLNAHHFDYCGLIPKGLAIEAPKDLYK